MERPVNVRLIVACVGLIVFLALAVYAAIGQNWPLFFVAVALTALSAAAAMVMGEWWRAHRGDVARPRLRSRR
ncbi:hypothetical protein [Sphaerisporangium sp. TRM90804]|uniref:hypothetical protein n=1 Tax=Sphaerisporangium sp. TRM90804 TaxID=3031113 RepID=UPI00244A2E20|nr:hypothetical protein [Sphaerisporangium sp. TRM90804]MDH2424615.1 hypothetical protein [Sphaerisporangium sp. TRM90804]